MPAIKMGLRFARLDSSLGIKLLNQPFDSRGKRRKWVLLTVLFNKSHGTYQIGRSEDAISVFRIPVVCRKEASHPNDELVLLVIATTRTALMQRLKIRAARLTTVAIDGVLAIDT